MEKPALDITTPTIIAVAALGAGSWLIVLGQCFAWWQ
jgi:hypothetical protein